MLDVETGNDRRWNSLDGRVDMRPWAFLVATSIAAELWDAVSLWNYAAMHSYRV